MKLNGEALKFLSNFYFTEQNLYRPDLQKILSNVTFQLTLLHIDHFFSSNLLCALLQLKKIERGYTK